MNFYFYSSFTFFLEQISRFIFLFLYHSMYFYHPVSFFCTVSTHFVSIFLHFVLSSVITVRACFSLVGGYSQHRPV